MGLVSKLVIVAGVLHHQEHYKPYPYIFIHPYPHH